MEQRPLCSFRKEISKQERTSVSTERPVVLLVEESGLIWRPDDCAQRPKFLWDCDNAILRPAGTG